ncbi:MAG: thiazole synthase [Selenomonas sp.]|jgi:thiazole synthase|nr:thiazole synthase [Selenomonas sp.]MCI7331163.1 thiazole synthase [Selenomonadaceae bacterium]MDD6120801.1 thiazole synthase [Selenomonadaceae bacterium]MDD7056550.1 thiazole synthase [Selenomonadaceae bacterium]MDY3916022.1 thiazole synthase [Selenomonadaceae bacterium]
MDKQVKDTLRLGGQEFISRLFLGTGKFRTYALMQKAVQASGAQVVTTALRRADPDFPQENILSYMPRDITFMPNTSGARTAREAVRIAHLAKAMGCGNWIKVEVISDNRYLMPDNFETVKATEQLVKEGFTVLPYINPDLGTATRLVEAGAAAVMPLAAPIGSNRGLRTRELLRILIEEIDVPIVVDAGIGKPSEACEAMEMGADAVLVNTAVAVAGDPVQMAAAFKLAVAAGRQAYLARPGRVLSGEASASSPLTGFLHMPHEEVAVHG